MREKARLGIDEPLRILLVDDSADDCELLEMLFRRDGLSAYTRRVDNPADFQTALEEDWDLVILDWVLPHFSAPEALQALRAKTSTPCVVVSGVVGEEIAVLALKLGAQDFVRKDQMAALVPIVHREVLFWKADDDSTL